MNSPVTMSHLTFAWPDSTIVLDDVTVSLGTGRTGLVGDNGVGKTTLLRLIAGQLQPSSGTIAVAGEVAYLPQVVGVGSAGTTSATVADLLGVADKLAALRAIESGSLDPRHFEVVGSDWDVETQIDQVLRGLDAVGGSLAGASPDRLASTLSGGEAMVVAIAGCRLRGAPITLLDEPTNNLDEVLRQAVVEMIATWPGIVVVVSHDIGLLEAMDAIAELYERTLTIFGGPYSQWKEAVASAQAAALQAQRAARQQVRVTTRQRIATTERTARNLARGKQKAIGEGIGKAGRDKMKGTAEASAARRCGAADQREQAAAETLRQADDRVRVFERIAIDLPDPAVHASRRIFELTWGDGERIIIEGPERVALTGRTGVGKTTLIEQMLRGGREVAEPIAIQATMDATTRGVASERPRGRLLTDRVGYLPQRLELLDDAVSAVDNVLAKAPSATLSQVRSGLARLLIRGDAVFRPVGTLSGGERCRVGLACLLFAAPPAQLLILDEPTNNLDIHSVDHLIESLSAYRGCLLVVSHNQDFLTALGVTRRLELVAHPMGVTIEHHP